MRVLFAGGGTGGHVFPALSVADELKSRLPGFEALFVGTKDGLEAGAVPDAGYPIRFISSRSVRGKGFPGKLLTLTALSVGLLQAARIISRFKPNLVFGSGGYASAAAILAASLLRRRIVLQEQNSIPGLTNRLLAPRAARIYLGFEKAREYMGKHRGLVVTGNPLRREIVSEGVRRPREVFGLAEGSPLLLVFGGSQGASRLNRAAVEFILAREDVQAILQTGGTDYGWMRESLKGAEGRVFVSPFLKKIHVAYRAADVALARAGALSISELAAVGLPSILVPYPFAADDHQRHNASLLVSAGGAVLMENGQLSGRSLGDVLARLLGDRAGLERMKRSLLSVARFDAARRITDDILSLCTGAGSGSANRFHAGVTRCVS